MKIGTFIQDQEGTLHGRIFGLGIGVTSVVLEPQTSRDGKGYFRLIADPLREAYEIGVAFPKQKDGMIYHSVSIDSPALAGPLNAALFPNKEQAGEYNLVWNRLEALNLKTEATPKGDRKTHRNAPQAAL